MLQNSYDRKIMEKSYDLVILLIGIVVGFIGLFYIRTTGISPLYLLDLLFFLSSITIYILRKKISFKIKTLIVVFFLLILFVYSFLVSGFIGASIKLLGGIILIAFAFHSIKLGVFISIFGGLFISVLTFLGDLGFYNFKPVSFEVVNRQWFQYIQLLSSLIFIAVIYISVKSIRIILGNQVERLNASLLIIDSHKEELEKLAYYDRLTGLPNRDKFKKEVEGLINEFSYGGILIHLDIRDFSTYNSLFGNDYGDEILKVIGDELKELITDFIKICRISSDEFAIWGSGWNNESAFAFFLEVKDKVNRALLKKGYSHNLSWHIGSCSLDERSSDFTSCFRNSLIAAEWCKKEKVEGINLFKSEMELGFERENEILFHLESAINSDEFNIVFQGKHNPDSGELVGLEALSRWNSKVLGTVSPVEFIPLGSGSKVFDKFSRYLIKKTMATFVDGSDKLGDNVTLSINISPRFFLVDDFVKFVIESCKITGLPTTRLTLEITEDLLISDMEVIIAKGKELKSYGIDLSLDDFGTGYSSLKYLTTLSFNEIKIDKSFINNIVHSSEAYSLLSSIVAIAKITGYRVVAEGVEYKEQVEAVKRAGCNIIQGFFFSKPVDLTPDGIKHLLGSSKEK